ncbi:MAG: hypothetical protein HQK54_11940 [Oligoflexales bacterium]|nr:hypothetical protein [Oligoflexales bacterium]
MTSIFDSIKSKLKNLLVSDADPDNRNAVPADDQTFIRLIQLINEDQGFSEMIMKIINMDSFNRASMLNSIIHEQGLKGANAEHLQVLKYLTDDVVCEKIKDLVKRNG